MKYYIADPDEKTCIDLKRILDNYNLLEYRGSFKTSEKMKLQILKEPPDIAFIRIGSVEINAFKLVGFIREQNIASKVIFLSKHEEYAVEAFECDVEGLILLPFNEKKINHLLMRILK